MTTTTCPSWCGNTPHGELSEHHETTFGARELAVTVSVPIHGDGPAVALVGDGLHPVSDPTALVEYARALLEAADLLEVEQRR